MVLLQANKKGSIENILSIYLIYFRVQSQNEFTDDM